MSMTSRVNPELQKAIVTYLSTRTLPVSNSQLFFNIPVPANRFPDWGYYSLRAVQEATQKLTKAGILASPQRGLYVLASTPVATAATV